MACSVAGQKTSCSRAGSRSRVSSAELKPERGLVSRRLSAHSRWPDFCAWHTERLVTGQTVASTGLCVRKSWRSLSEYRALSEDVCSQHRRARNGWAVGQRGPLWGSTDSLRRARPSRSVRVAVLGCLGFGAAPWSLLSQHLVGHGELGLPSCRPA